MLELFPHSARIEGGELVLGGVRASELAARFGTPLVAYCEDTLRRQARALSEAAGAGGRVFYGTKAFPNVALLRLLRQEGAGADVASSGELAFALAAGLSGDEVIVHGNNKDEALLREAARHGAFVVRDAPDETGVAAAVGVERALVRVTLGVDADTHEAMVTGHHGSKFGLPPAEAKELVATRSRKGSRSSAFTSTSGPSFPTSARRRRRSVDSWSSRRRAVTSSGGKCASPISGAASASATTPRTTFRRPPSWLRRRP